MSDLSVFLRRIAISSMLAIAALSPAWGQATSSLRGVITDAQGAAVESAHVSLQSVETAFRRSTLTTGDGNYQFLQVPPVAYTVVVEQPGF